MKGDYFGSDPTYEELKQQVRELGIENDVLKNDKHIIEESEELQHITTI